MLKRLDRLMSKITKNPTEKGNIYSFGLSGLLKAADRPLISGTELQAFQVRAGFTNTQIGLIGSCASISSTVFMFLLVGVSDRIRNRKRMYIWLTVIMASYPAVLLFLSLSPEWIRRPEIMVPVMAVATIFESAVIALIGMVTAALFVRTISPGVQGRCMSLTGVGGGLAGIVVALISSQALRYLDYPLGFAVAFSMAVGLLAISALVAKNIQELPELACKESPAPISPLPAIFRVMRTREFLLLAPPNILRGFGVGAGIFAMSVGMKRLNLGVEYAGYTTALIYMGYIMGNTAIGFTVDRYGAGIVLAFSFTLLAISLVGLALSPGPLLFLMFFLLMYTASSWESGAIPLAHYAIVPTEMIGAFSGARLMLYSGTAAIAVPTAGYLLDFLSPIYVFGGCAVLNFITGLLYWYAFNKGHKTPPVPPPASVVEEEQEGDLLHS